MTRQRQLRVQGVFNLEILNGNVGFVRRVRWKTACNFCQKNIPTVTRVRATRLQPEPASSNDLSRPAKPNRNSQGDPNASSADAEWEPSRQDHRAKLQWPSFARDSMT